MRATRLIIDVENVQPVIIKLPVKRERLKVVSIDLDSWDSFEETISSFFEKWNRLKKRKYPRRVSTPLFRGHSNASWKLRTTLDRFDDIPCEASGYYGIH